MTRVKRGTTSLKHRRNILKRVKGYRWGRSKKERFAHEAILHAGTHAFAHRRKKKGDFRRIWNIRISAAAKANGTSYSKLAHDLKKKDIKLNRKMLSIIAAEEPKIFETIIKS